MAVAFEKYHGTGNDFLICADSEPVEDWGAFAVEHCDRETGLEVGGRRGADGVLVLSIEGSSRVRMELYQPDGGTAAMCGNGARCAARWAARRERCAVRSEARTVKSERGGTTRERSEGLGTRERPEAASEAERTGKTEFVIDTPAGERHATVGEETIEIEMGVPSFAPEDVPLAGSEPLIREEIAGHEMTAVHTGVPHAVLFIGEVATVDLDGLAPPIRHAEVFPEGANVNVAAVRDGGFDQRTFERGVEGETRSCGTGAVAIAAVAKRLGLTNDERVSVSPPGGELTVQVPEEGPAVLSGPVEFEGSGEVPTP